jgi:hypothetical protein
MAAGCHRFTESPLIGMSGRTPTLTLPIRSARDITLAATEP